MEHVLKIWTFFNNKKTAIGATCFALSDIATAFAYPDIAEGLKNLAYIFTGTGLTHKGAKAVTK